MIEPIWGNVVVLPDDINDTDPMLKKAKEMGFEMPTESKREQHAQVEGTIVASGGNAFEDWKGVTPEVGDRVIFDKYCGFAKDHEGKTYRIIRDTDIVAIMK